MFFFVYLPYLFIYIVMYSTTGSVSRTVFPSMGITVNFITSYNQQRMGLLDGSDHWAWENLLWFYLLVPGRWGSQMSCIFVDGHVFSPTLVTIIGIYMYYSMYIYIRVHDWWVWVKYPNFRMVSDNDHDVNIDNTVWWSFPAFGCENPTYGESVYMIIFLYFCENWISREEKLTNLYTADWILILMVISLPAEKIIRSIKRSLKSLKKS